MATSQGDHAATCPGCSARIPAHRPLFCDYCGTSLPANASDGEDGGPAAATAEFERRLAAMQRESMGRIGPSRSRAGQCFLLVSIALFFLIAGCMFVGSRIVPPP